MTATTASELRTHRAIGLQDLIDCTPAVLAAKRYMDEHQFYFSHQHRRRFIAAVRKAYSEVMLGRRDKRYDEDRIAWKVVERIAKAQKEKERRECTW